MKKQYLQNEKLDKAGNRLIKAARISSDEIEEIIAAPQLFNSVKARIKAEESNRHKKVSVFDWAFFGVWNWQKAGIAFAVSAIFFFSVLGILIFRKQEPITAQKDKPETQSQNTAIKVSQTSQNSGNSPEKNLPDEFINEPQKFIQKAAFKPQNDGLRRPIQKLKATKRQQQPEKETKGEFIQLTYAGNLEQTSEDEQIIRVEIPRSSLTALGVSAPTENENGKVKTDLLIGSDGVVRAVRLVK